jgi:hypothetical protein
MLERSVLQISAVAMIAGALGWCWLIYSEFHSPVLVAPAVAAIDPATADEESSAARSVGASTAVRIDHPSASATADRIADRESAASIVAREWSLFEPKRLADRVRSAIKQAAKEPSTAKEPTAAKERTAAKEPPTAAKERTAAKETAAKEQTLRAAAREATLRPQIHLASLETVAPQISGLHLPAEPVPSRIPFIGARTSLVDFETAPFPYHGAVPGSNRPFLNAGEEGHRGHVNFRGRVFWESQTFSDDRVLLHIPPGFDPRRPAVMVVFFHGHGANLARDVRDRQQVPAQITAAGTNAVLVAPQFAVNAADSSAGKFWEPNGFKRFLDEAAVKLASLYGDEHSAAAFANMPIVIVAYSGGFGPTLSVLDRGGVRSRVRGVVLLDALYAGIDRFADWISNNRSSFFVSSYTPHTAGHNAYLERLLRERGVSYDAELRGSHLRGMVAFLPAGPISHRDFVNRAWAEAPIKDVLVRMDDVGPQYANAETTALLPAAALAGRRN